MRSPWLRVVWIVFAITTAFLHYVHILPAYGKSIVRNSRYSRAKLHYSAEGDRKTHHKEDTDTIETVHGSNFKDFGYRKPVGSVPKNPANTTFYRCLHPDVNDRFRVAIAFFGISRKLELTLPSIRKRVFEVLERHQIPYDIFWYTTTTPKVHHLHYRERHIPAEDIDPFDVRLLKPCRFSVVDQDALREESMQKFFSVRNITAKNLSYDIWKDNYHSMRNVLGCYHTQEMLERSIAVHTRMYNLSYDAYIVIRPDTAMIKDIDLPNYLSLLKAGGKQIWIPDMQHWLGLNDRAAFGTPQAMSLYLRRGVAYLSSTFRGSGEAFLRDYLQQHNITVHMSQMRVVRVRGDGTIPTPDFKNPEKYMNLPKDDIDLQQCVDSGSEKLKDSC